MPFLPSLPLAAGIGEIMKLNTAVTKAMHDLGVAIMRAPSPLTPAERELIAAYVSGLNRCDYCYKGHVQMAVNLGVERQAIEGALTSLEAAPIKPALRPVLAFVRKLTLSPNSITQADADAVYAAGWDERALHDAILVCCRFNFMNRLSIGHGLDPDAVSPEARAAKMNYDQPHPPE